MSKHNYFGVLEIANAELQLQDIPSSIAIVGPGGWNEFALTFDGYEHCGSSKSCAKLANKAWSEFATEFESNHFLGNGNASEEIAKRMPPRTLTEYRICLFYEQRRWRHLDSPMYCPNDDQTAVAYVDYLLYCIRDKTAKGHLE
jgi:hypothetical protein